MTDPNTELDRKLTTAIVRLETLTGSMTKFETQMAVTTERWASQLRDYVRREVWENERDAQRAQISEIKADAAAARARAATAIWAAAGSIVGALILTALQGGK